MKIRCALPLMLLFCVGCSQDVQPVQNAPIQTTGGLSFSLQLGKPQKFAGFSGLNQVTLAPEADSLVVKSTGDDPQITLPAVKLVNPSQFAAIVEITTPVDTAVQLFYGSEGSPGFTADRVASVNVKAGRSRVLFEINAPSLAGAFRFDPGTAPGTYIIHEFELFSSEPLARASAP